MVEEARDSGGEEMDVDSVYLSLIPDSPQYYVGRAMLRKAEHIKTTIPQILELVLGEIRKYCEGTADRCMEIGWDLEVDISGCDLNLSDEKIQDMLKERLDELDVKYEICIPDAIYIEFRVLYDYDYNTL